MPSSRPTHYTSGTLLSDIKQGRIKIPQFQRDFVWERERAARLLDSILKGYPLGTFILWKTQERLRAVRNIASLDLPTPPEGEFTYQVLDGQQRLTSLVAAMEGLPLKEDFGEICVDLDTDPATEEMVVYSRRDLVPAGHTAISFKQMLTAGPLALTRSYPSEPHLEMIQRHRDQFNAYPFPAVELSDASLAIATEIFTRLNVGGRSLTVFEIMVAKTWDEARGFDLLERVRQIDSEFSQVNYGGLDHQLFVQMVVAIARQNIRTKDLLEMRRAEFIDVWPVAMQALRAAVDFCRSDLSIPVRALLPSERVLIPLAYYFHLAGRILQRKVVRALAGCDFLFGCVDSADGRDALNRIAAFYTIPYIDVGVHLQADGHGSVQQVCAAVHYLIPDGSSLLSRRVITTEQVRAESRLATMATPSTVFSNIGAADSTSTATFGTRTIRVRPVRDSQSGMNLVTTSSTNTVTRWPPVGCRHIRRSSTRAATR